MKVPGAALIQGQCRRRSLPLIGSERKIGWSRMFQHAGWQDGKDQRQGLATSLKNGVTDLGLEQESMHELWRWNEGTVSPLTASPMLS